MDTNDRIWHDEVRVRAREVLATEVEGERVLLHPEKETYFGLNETGALIWTWIDEPITVAEIARRLTEEFEISDDEAARTTKTFLARLRREELIDLEYPDRTAHSPTSGRSSPHK